MADTSKNTHRIFLVDDHPAIRHGMSLMLRLGHHEVCGEAGDPAVALDQILAAAPDLVIVDLSLGNLHAYDLIAMLAQQEIPVLVYSMHEDTDSIIRSLRSGANGYLTKREDGDLLLEAVSQVLSTLRYLSPMAHQALQNRDRLAAEAETQLSEREIQIIALLAQGLGNSDIATELALSPRTVETYCTRIIKKYKLQGMKELRQFAIQHH